MEHGGELVYSPSTVQTDPLGRREAPIQAGVAQAFGLFWKSVLFEVTANAHTRAYLAQQRATEARTDLVLSELQGRQAIAEQTFRTQEAERHLAFDQLLMHLTPDECELVIGRETNKQALLARYENARACRLRGELPEVSRITDAGPVSSAPSEPTVTTHLTDEQIGQLAARALARYGALDPEQAAKEWENWEAFIHTNFTENLAEEIINRGRTLRQQAAA